MSSLKTPAKLSDAMIIELAEAGRRRDEQIAKGTFMKALEKVRVRSEQLQCCWNSWRVVSQKLIFLELPKDNCCDMAGAIEIATLLLPTVKEIHVYAGGKWDSFYLDSEAGWTAHDMRGLDK